MPDEKKKPLEELDLGAGLICDPETGICQIPGAGAQQPPAGGHQTNNEGER